MLNSKNWLTPYQIFFILFVLVYINIYYLSQVRLWLVELAVCTLKYGPLDFVVNLQHHVFSTSIHGPSVNHLAIN